MTSFQALLIGFKDSILEIDNNNYRGYKTCKDYHRPCIAA